MLVDMSERPGQGGGAGIVPEKQEGQNLRDDLVVGQVRPFADDSGKPAVLLRTPRGSNPLLEKIDKASPVAQRSAPGGKRSQIHLKGAQEKHPGTLEGEEEVVHQPLG